MKIRPFLLLFAVLQGFSQLAASETILNDTLESTTLLKTTPSQFSWTDSAWTSVVTHTPKVGDAGVRALRFTYAPGANESEQRFNLGKAYPDLWVRYWLQVPTNFKHNRPAGWPTNSKLFALWMDGYSNKGLGPTILWEFWEDGSSGSQLAVHYSEGNYTITGEHLQFKPFISYPSDQGRWMQIVLHAKASSKPGANDGLIQTYRRWSNENAFTQLHNVTNINMPMPSTGPFGWHEGYFMGWSNPSYVAETLFHINDVEFSTTSLLGLSSKPNVPDATLFTK